MKSASARREHYVGTWLPEPVVDPVVEPAGSPAGGEPHRATALAEDVSFALLMTLERLSPLERAAFLLHDVFDMDYASIAEVLDRSEAACRQLAARGRDHVRDERPRFEATPEATERLASAFRTAMFHGDLAGLARLLADDAVRARNARGSTTLARSAALQRRKASCATSSASATEPSMR